MSNKQTTVAPAEQASEEVLALHRQIAAEKLRADQGWQRAESKAKECAELRERLAKQTSEQVPTIDTPGFLRLLFAWHDAEMGRHSQEAYNAIVTHIDAHFAGQPAAPVAATEQATDDDLTDVLYPPRAALKAEDWDATTRKPKVKPVAPLATPADAGAGAGQNDEQLRETDGYKLGWMEGMQEGAELATGGEKTAADVEAEFANLLPGSYYMDPPDGGSPSILEQISRMAEDAAQWRAHLARPQAEETAWSHDLQDRLIAASQNIAEDDEARNVMAEAACLLAAITGTPGQELAHLSTPAAPVTASQPELTVWYGPMPESNGKSNYTAILMRKGGDADVEKLDNFTDGITIDRSEYPDRVRYEADRARYLIGELTERPDILAYDAEKHSGYVKPEVAAPVTAEPVDAYEWSITRHHDLGAVHDARGELIAQTYFRDASALTSAHNAAVHAICAAPVSPQPAAQVPSRDDVRNEALEQAARRVEADRIGFADDDSQLNAIARDIRALKSPVAANAAKEGGQQ